MQIQLHTLREKSYGIVEVAAKEKQFRRMIYTKNYVLSWRKALRAIAAPTH